MLNWLSGHNACHRLSIHDRHRSFYYQTYHLSTINTNNLFCLPQVKQWQYGTDSCWKHLQVRVHQALEEIQQHKKPGEITCLLRELTELKSARHAGNPAHANGVNNLPNLSRISILSSQISRWLSASHKTLFRLIQISPFQILSLLFS